MSGAIAPINKGQLLESVLIKGDLSKLTEEQRVVYYREVCSSVGLNPLTKPFEYITLNGKLTLYAKRDATDQLRKLHNVSITIVAREKIDDVYVVTARGRMPDGREDESTGAVTIGNLKGDNLANAFMKAETKAKRRVTLSICGLGLLDETEVEAVPAQAKGEQIAARITPAIPNLDPHPVDEVAAEPEVEQEERLSDYVCKVGKNKGKRLADIKPVERANFLKWYDAQVAENVDLHPNVHEYAMALRAYEAELEAP